MHRATSSSPGRQWFAQLNRESSAKEKPPRVASRGGFSIVILSTVIDYFMKRGILDCMKRFDRKKLYAAAGIGIIFVGGIAVGYTIAPAGAFEAATFFNSVGPVRSASPNFTLTHPLIAYETPEATGLAEYSSLKKQLQDSIDRAKAEGNVSDVSLYYRSLETGRWIGIKQNSIYYPASLLKVPVMIAYFRSAESNPGLFDKRIAYRPITGGNSFEAPSQLVVGRLYTVRELIEHMIEDSDNGATYTLLSIIDENLLSEVYTDLGIPDPGDDSADYQISTKTYALFFRILYNATYLSPTSSEDALKLLVRASYRDGLAAGIPKGIAIANKYGEHVMSVSGTAKGEELHDCGIVYRPGHPYLLCVMTRAKDLPSATALISSISKAVYEASETR